MIKHGWQITAATEHIKEELTTARTPTLESATARRQQSRWQQLAKAEVAVYQAFKEAHVGERIGRPFIQVFAPANVTIDKYVVPSESGAAALT